MLKSRKKINWIVVAFLLLCIVSVYRQIFMRFYPGDTVRPVVVFFFYLILLVGWWISVCNRIVQRNIRFFLLAEHAFMLFGITTRFLMDAFVNFFTQKELSHSDIFLMRLSGSAMVIPMILLPLCGLYASFGLGKTEGYRFNRKWYLLLIPAAVLVLMILTNESHHFVYLPVDEQSVLYYYPAIGFYIIAAWAFSLLLGRILLIFIRSREPRDYSRWRIAPFLIAVFMILYNIPYVAASFVVRVELIEYYVFLFFLEAMVWESCIIVGMVPVNTRYKEVFDRSTVSMQIINDDGRLCLKSASAPEITEERFNQLKRSTTVRTPEGMELHLHTIRGGYAIWQHDVSQTTAVIDELHKSMEKLENESDILRQELRIRSEESTLKEQNQIYNQLTDEVGGQLSLLQELLDEQHLVTDKTELFKKICLIGTYIKRRCNLRLIELSNGVLSGKDLELCYQELAGCLQQMGVSADVFWSAPVTLTPEFAIFTLDLFELLLEHEHFELQAIKVVFNTDTVFSTQVYYSAGSSGKIPYDELQQKNSENYHMSWETLINGYQISVREGR